MASDTSFQALVYLSLDTGKCVWDPHKKIKYLFQEKSIFITKPLLWQDCGVCAFLIRFGKEVLKLLTELVRLWMANWVRDCINLMGAAQKRLQGLLPA